MKKDHPRPPKITTFYKRIGKEMPKKRTQNSDRKHHPIRRKNTATKHRKRELLLTTFVKSLLPISSLHFSVRKGELLKPPIFGALP